MAGKTAKFFYYTLSAKNKEKKTVNLKEVLQTEDFEDHKITITRDQSGRHYTLIFSKQPGDCLYGKIYRTKNSKGYYYKKEKKVANLSDVLGETAEAGESERDIVNFVLAQNKEDLIVLMQQGLQYPGIGVLQEFFKELTSKHGYNYEHEMLKTQKAINALKKVFDRPLKEMFFTIKKNAQLPKDWPVEEFLEQMNFGQYEFTLRVHLRETVSKDAPLKIKVKTALNRLVNKKPSDDTINNLFKIDFVELFYRFQIVAYLDEVQKTTVTEDILSEFEKEEIQVSKALLENGDESTITHLCDLLKQKIDSVKSESG